MRLVALVAIAIWAAPAAGQSIAAANCSLGSKPLIEPDLQISRSGFSLPVIEYLASDGTRKRSRGIIIGRDVAPNTVVGLGVFSTAPKSGGPPEGPLAPAKKSKKVAFGISVRF